MITDLNCILLLSDINRKDMRDNISDLTVYGVKIISDIREVTDKLLKETNKVIIIGKYPYESVSELILFRELLDLEYFYIGTDDLLVDLMGEYCSRSVNLDYTAINNNLIYSVLYDDKVLQDEFEIRADFKKIEDRVEFVNNTTKDSQTKELCEYFLSYREHVNMVLKSKEQLEKLLRESRGICSNIEKQRDAITLSYEGLLAKVVEHQRVLSDYEVILSRDIYDKVGLAKYPTAPKILYIKEYQELIHMESFISTLFNSVSLQGNLSTKVVRLHDSVDINRINILSSNYHVVRESFLTSDIISNDFILSVGSYMKLFDLLLTNKYKLDLLIIIDCKMYNQAVINGNYLFLNAVRNRRNLVKLGLGSSNTITNNPEDLLCWTEDEIFYDPTVSEEDRFITLSAKPVIRRLLNMVKE